MNSADKKQSDKKPKAPPKVPFTKKIKEKLASYKKSLIDALPQVIYFSEMLIYMMGLYATLALTAILLLQRFLLVFNTQISLYIFLVAAFGFAMFKGSHLWALFKNQAEIRSVILTEPEAVQAPPAAGLLSQCTSALSSCWASVATYRNYLIYGIYLLFSLPFFDVPYYYYRVYGKAQDGDTTMFRELLAGIEAQSMIFFISPTLLAFTTQFLMGPNPPLFGLQPFQFELGVYSLMSISLMAFMIGVYKLQQFIIQKPTFSQAIAWSLLRVCEFTSRTLLLASFVSICLKNSDFIPLGVYTGLQFLVAVVFSYVFYYPRWSNTLEHSVETIRSVFFTFLGRLFYLPYNESALLFPSLNFFDLDEDNDPYCDIPDWYYENLVNGWEKRRCYTFVVWSLRVFENVNLFLFIFRETTAPANSMIALLGAPIAMGLTAVLLIYYLAGGIRTTYFASYDRLGFDE